MNMCGQLYLLLMIFRKRQQKKKSVSCYVCVLIRVFVCVCKIENMFALFTPICLCGSALTSTWDGKEAEYAKQFEQRLITLELLRRKMLRFLDFC